MALKKAQITVSVGNAPETIRDATKIYLADNKARSLSVHTLGTNTRVLKALTDFLDGKPIAEVSSGDLRRFFIEKATATSPATAQRYYNCIHAFFRFLQHEEFISADPMTGVQKPKAPTPIIEPLSQEQIEAMLNTCGKKFTGIRNRLVLMTLVDCGLRASELCDLTVSDIDWEEQLFLVRHGKGDKARRVPFGSAVASTMRQYLARRAVVDTPYLFVTCYGDQVDRYRLRAIVARVAAKAGVVHPHMGPHLMRHTCAVLYLRAGGDVFSLQRILGHSTLVMTRRYSELADSDVSDKHRLFSPADRLQPAVKTGRKRLS